jgi:hypothetical protein
MLAAGSGNAEGPRPQTHDRFVDSCLTDLASQLLSGFTPNRTQPVAIVRDLKHDSNGVFAAELSRILSARGLLIRDTASPPSDAADWSLYYSLAPVQLTLSEPQRRDFLGMIWVKRSLQAGLQVNVQDNLEGSIWTDSRNSTYTDWVAKRDLAELANERYSPEVPSTGWERARTPLIIGGGAAVLGLLILTLH